LLPGTQHTSDTICAIATAPGRGGVGIVRVSGPKALNIATQCLHITPKPRYAHLSDFYDQHNTVIDQGIALFFPNPHSFTGEDVFEFQGHGGPVILDTIVEQCLLLGARLARPGEFSERAFLNDKLDLVQAEAIADLIDASSKQAARQALNSLRGAFSNEVDTLLEQLTHLRLYVESAIDFPEEEIDFLSDGIVETKLNTLATQVITVLHSAKQGVVMREGMKVVLAGRPNAGKSTLLNALVERDVAIVTDIAGTTRDTLSEHIHIDGMPLHIIDTAGIHETNNKVEKLGIERAWNAINDSDRILLLLDASDTLQRPYDDWKQFFDQPELKSKLTLIYNKADLAEYSVAPANDSTQPVPGQEEPVSLLLSAKSGAGIDTLKTHLLSVMGISQTTEGQFSARRRHIDALQQTLAHLEQGKHQLEGYAAGELLAEDLRLAQQSLGEITGKLSPDELLGKIFSSFCIGK